MVDGRRRLPPEHDVELREAEDERIALVDEHDLDGVAERLGKNRRQLQATEAGAENNHSCRHGSVSSISRERQPQSRPSAPSIAKAFVAQTLGCGTKRRYGRGARQPSG